jgi:hypothetical protein
MEMRPSGGSWLFDGMPLAAADVLAAICEFWDSSCRPCGCKINFIKIQMITQIHRFPGIGISTPIHCCFISDIRFEGEELIVHQRAPFQRANLLGTRETEQKSQLGRLT